MCSYLPIAIFIDPVLLTDLQQRGVITSTFLNLNSSRREAIVASILEEAALRGPTLINIKEVAHRAGVSIGSLYQYFNHRQGLLDFAVELITKQMVTAFSHFKQYLIELPLREALRAYLNGGNEWAKEYQGYVRYFTRAAYQDDPVCSESVVQPVAVVMLDMTRDILNAAQLRGEIRDDIDLEAMARLVNTLLLAVYDAQYLPHLNTYYQLMNQDCPPERIVENMLILIENALKP